MLYSIFLPTPGSSFGICAANPLGGAPHRFRCATTESMRCSLLVATVAPSPFHGDNCLALASVFVLSPLAAESIIRPGREEKSPSDGESNHRHDKREVENSVHSDILTQVWAGLHSSGCQTQR